MLLSQSLAAAFSGLQQLLWFLPQVTITKRAPSELACLRDVSPLCGLPIQVSWCQSPSQNRSWQNMRIRVFLLMRQVISQEDVKECIKELDELEGDVDDTVARHGSRAVIEPDGGTLRSVYALHLDPASVMGRMSTSLPIVACAQQILGGDVYVHQSRLNLQKAFHGTGFSWHSDFETWHSEDGLPKPRATTAVLLMDRNRAVNGSLMVIPGSHRWFVACPGRQESENWKTSLRSQQYGTPGEQELSLLAEAGDVVHCTGEPGDLLLFDNNLLHSSASNRSPWHRRNLFTVFNNVHNQLEPPFYADQPRPEHIGHRKHCATLFPLQKKL